jgi:hypothetical protein
VVSLSFVADFNVEQGSRESDVADERFGGISAVAYDAVADRWLALSDARTSPRFYELALDYDGVSLHVHVGEATGLRERDGVGFGENELDPEGLVETTWGTLLISTEPDSRYEPIVQAKLLEFEQSGELVRSVPLPAKFLVEGWPPRSGPRNNRGFESLTLAPSGARLFVGAEGALLQDGEVASFDAAAFCRIVEYRVQAGALQPSAEYVYPLGPVARPDTFSDPVLSSGLVELVALSDTRLLALERDFIGERGESGGVNRARIFLVDVAGATDVSRVSSLAASPGFRPVRKQKLLDFDDIVAKLSPGFRSLDNFEGMGLGPTLPDGGRSLLVVSDDNFSDTQRSAFLLFSLKVVNE